MWVPKELSLIQHAQLAWCTWFLRACTHISVWTLMDAEISARLVGNEGKQNWSCNARGDVSRLMST